MKKERTVENQIRSVIKSCGAKCYKWVSPGCAGVPDRLCIFPGGRIIFVEVKREGLKDGLSPQQQKVSGDLKNLGCIVWRINNKEDLINRLSEIGYDLKGGDVK